MNRIACVILSSLLAVLPFSGRGDAQPEEGDFARDAEMFILAFRNGLVTDFPAALRLSGAPGLWDRWKSRMPGLFDNNLDSAAFFSHVQMSIWPRPDGAFIVSFGNIWVDALVLFRVDRVEKGLKAVDFALLDRRGGILPPEDWRIAATELAGLEETIRIRWATAVPTFHHAAAAMTGGTPGEAVEKEHGGLPASEAVARLEEHVKRCREALAPEATADRAPLIGALEQSMKWIVEGAPPATPVPEAITKIRSLPDGWRTQLEPSFVISRPDGSAMVVLAEATEPGYMVLLDLHPGEKGRELRDARLAIMTGSENK